MRFIFIEILKFFFIIIILINKSLQEQSIKSVEPLTIKINPERIENISMTIIFEEEIINRANTKIILNGPKSIVYYGINEDNQDQNYKKKVEFLIILKDFVNNYGKYRLYYSINGESEKLFNQYIFIYTNDLILKNPKHKYELTGNNDIRTIKYDLTNQIFKDEINRIEYYKDNIPNEKFNLSINDYSIEDGTKLVINFTSQNSEEEYIFDIYPEYDKEISNSEIQRFYLHFHDYLLKNDAIYINKQNNTNKIPFKILLKESFVQSNFIISDDTNKRYECLDISYTISNNYYLYKCYIDIGRKISPGKISILYKNTQLRELFLILYTTDMKKCYDKEDIENLNITMEWIEEMEYAHNLYFDEGLTKVLTPTYLSKSGSSINYRYKTATTSLNSGSFYLRSTIPSLNYADDYNPVNNENLYIYIYPNNKFSDNNHIIIYSHNISKQFINITFDDPYGATVLDEIILRKNSIDSKEIKPSLIGKQCQIINYNIFSCDLKDLIYNFEDDKVGDYSIYYNSKCNVEKQIEGKVVTIKRGISLLSINPIWIENSKAIGTIVYLGYDEDLSGKNIKICIYKTKGTFFRNYTSVIINKNVISFFLIDNTIGLYHIRTIIENVIGFDEDNLGFKIIERIQDFKFNHHYFVLNNEPTNKLIITANNNTRTFGCKIIETSENKSLNNSKDCSSFEYPIKKLGTLKFNYSDIDGFLIPINDEIVVVNDLSYYFPLFDLEKYCYYYNFDISIYFSSSFKNKFNIIVFLKSIRDNSIFILKNTSHIYIRKKK